MARYAIDRDTRLARLVRADRVADRVIVGGRRAPIEVVEVKSS